MSCGLVSVGFLLLLDIPSVISCLLVLEDNLMASEALMLLFLRPLWLWADLRRAQDVGHFRWAETRHGTICECPARCIGGRQRGSLPCQSQHMQGSLFARRMFDKRGTTAACVTPGANSSPMMLLCAYSGHVPDHMHPAPFGAGALAPTRNRNMMCHRIACMQTLPRRG